MSQFAKQLGKFLKDNNLKSGDAADALGVSRVTLYQWLNDIVYPNDASRAAIAKWTRGAVAPPAQQREKLKKVQPFNPSKNTGT